MSYSSISYYQNCAKNTNWPMQLYRQKHFENFPKQMMIITNKKSIIGPLDSVTDSEKNTKELKKYQVSVILLYIKKISIPTYKLYHKSKKNYHKIWIANIV